MIIFLWQIVLILTSLEDCCMSRLSRLFLGSKGQGHSDIDFEMINSDFLDFKTGTSQDDWLWWVEELSKGQRSRSNWPSLYEMISA